MKYDVDLNRNERMANESFDKYRARRKLAKNTERLRHADLRGGSQSSRSLARHPAPIMVGDQVVTPTPIRGNYGRNLVASMNAKRHERCLAARGR